MKPSPIPQAADKRFGLFGLLESQRVILPLKAVECEFSVRGGMAEVAMSQIFRQENALAVDCEYLFPLPADAAVYACEADINGRVIRAVIKERDEARRLAAQKKAEGHRTALVESERDNLFALTLGNVQADDLIIVRLKYFQPLRMWGGSCSVEIPFCPGVRYIPGKPLLRGNRGQGTADDTDEVPDASRISPVRIGAGHPDAAYVDVRGTLDAACLTPGSLASPSHAIEIQAMEGEIQVTLSSKGEAPDRDLVLRWNERSPDTLTPRAWARQKGNEVYALLEARAPRQIPADRAGVDFYFMVDRSGSMTGVKWSKAVDALQSCVKILGPEDRAMVTFFETNFQDFAEGPLPAGDLLADVRFQTLKSLGTTGGTMMAPALKHVLEIADERSEGRARTLILITDAQIGNDAGILNLAKLMPEMPVHCFGIDIALNDALLLALARQQGGTFHSMHPGEDIAAAVTEIGRTLCQPALLDLRLPEGWECADGNIPNLYAGQVLHLSVRGSVAGPIELTARNHAGEAVTLVFQLQMRTAEAPFLLWCKSRIQRCLAERNHRDAIALSVASNLLCRATAFVAWDDAEKVVIARQQLAQPNVLMEAVMGLAMDKSANFLMDRQHLESQPVASVILAELDRICLLLVGDDWKPSLAALADWLKLAPPGESESRLKSVRRLLLKLSICLQIKTVMGSKGPAGYDRLKQLSEKFFHPEIRRQKCADDDFKELEETLRKVEALDKSATREELSAFALEVYRQAVETLKTFASKASLPSVPNPGLK